MTIRVLYNYLLVRLGVRKILPKEIINRVEVRECNEPIVALSAQDNIVQAQSGMYGRKGMIDRLLLAAKELETQNLNYTSWSFSAHRQNRLAVKKSIVSGLSLNIRNTRQGRQMLY